MATMQSLDIRRRSASNEAPPQIRQTGIEVAKLAGLPEEVVQGTSGKYRDAFRRLTGWELKSHG